MANQLIYRLDGFDYQTRADELACDGSSYGHVLMYGTSHLTNARKYVSDKVNFLNIHGASIDALDRIIDKSCGPRRRLILVRVISPIELYERIDYFDINRLPKLGLMSSLLNKHVKWLYRTLREEGQLLSYSLISRKKWFISRRLLPNLIIDAEQRFKFHEKMYDFKNISGNFAESLAKHLEKDRCIILIESPISREYSKLIKKSGLEVDITSYLLRYGIERKRYAYIDRKDFDRADGNYYIDADHLNEVGWSIYWKIIESEVEKSMSKCWNY
jgi:hypothetical protein